MTLPDFSDPRLVAIYETANAYAPGTQPDFYAALAEELGARDVVELGCGTGLVARHLSERGLRVVGVEPSEAMLAVARSYDSPVRWVLGGHEALPRGAADLAVMAGHVAQFFLADGEWNAALRSLRAALRPGGWLAFESRDPAAREWESWGARTVAGDVETWSVVTSVDGPVVSYENHYLAGGEHLVSPSALRFRTLGEIEESLAANGFELERAYGAWDRRPAGTGHELVVVARRPTR